MFTKSITSFYHLQVLHNKFHCNDFYLFQEISFDKQAKSLERSNSYVHGITTLTDIYVTSLQKKYEVKAFRRRQVQRQPLQQL